MYGLCVAIQLTIACLFELPVCSVPSERPSVTAQLVTEEPGDFNRKLQRPSQIGVTTVTNAVWLAKVDGDTGQKRVSILSLDQCGMDISEWYGNTLFEQETFMMLAAIDALGDSLPVIPLSMEIPDVHRFVTSPDRPSTDEVTARLIPTNIESVGTAHGHTTIVEIDHKHQPPEYYLAKNPVFRVSDGAASTTHHQFQTLRESRPWRSH